MSLWTILTRGSNPQANETVMNWFPPLAALQTVRLRTKLAISFGVILTLLVAVVALARLGIAMYQRHRQGPAFSKAELAFLATSLSLFHPYLWVRNINLATIGVLVGHFLQYLGIVWLVHARKLAEGGGSSASSPTRWRGRRSCTGA